MVTSEKLDRRGHGKATKAILMRNTAEFRAIIVRVATVFTLALTGHAYGQTAHSISPETVENIAPEIPAVQETVGKAAPLDAPGKRFFGKGSPFGVHDLPEGDMKTGLLALEPVAREKAMNQLHSFTFQQRGAMECLRVDRQGRRVVETDHAPPRFFRVSVTQN